MFGSTGVPVTASDDLGRASQARRPARVPPGARPGPGGHRGAVGSRIMGMVTARGSGSVARPLRKGLRRLGYDIVRTSGTAWPGDFTADEVALCRRVAPRTMTSPEALVTLAAAVRHVIARRCPAPSSSAASGGAAA